MGYGPTTTSRLANANLPGVLAQDVDELQADWVAECLRNLGHAQGVVTVHVRVDDGLATALPGGALLLGRKFEIDDHQSIYIY